MKRLERMELPAPLWPRAATDVAMNTSYSSIRCSDEQLILCSYACVDPNKDKKDNIERFKRLARCNGPAGACQVSGSWLA